MGFKASTGEQILMHNRLFPQKRRREKLEDKQISFNFSGIELCTSSLLWDAI